MNKEKLIEMGLEVDKARRRSETIIRTETARINVEAALDSMEEIGCGKVQIVETLDMTTCEECGSYDGNIVELKDAVAGKDVPPFHPNCRGCTVPYYDDPYFKKGGKRAARDPETGKTVLVEEMTYKEWKEKYVKPVEKSANSGIIKIKNSDLPNGLPLNGAPNSTVDKTDDNGKVLQRRKYGADGKAAVDFDTTDHGFPYNHPTGAHKHIFDYTKKNPHGSPLPLTEKELKENSDIIKRGVNYHDKE